MNKEIKKYKNKIKRIKNKNKIKKYKKIIKKYKKIKKIKKYIKEIKKMLIIEKEKEMIELIKEEIEKEKNKIKNLKEIIKKKIKKEEKIILEIKPGVGGLESFIFISDLKKMYEKYIEKMGWKKKIISGESTEFGGHKNSIIIIKGKNIYKNLRFESGVHRVQRLPKTENKNRVHTSTCRVAVYKHKNNKKNKLKKDDLKIETFKSSGAGGQHVNKTDSAVRIKHIPTNIVVECQKERSQHKNKKYALKIIKIKILKKYNLEKKKNINKEKKNLLGEGERNEKIRTYNYKKNTIIDHRFKINLKNLNKIMQGNLKEMINKIKNAKKKKKK